MSKGINVLSNFDGMSCAMIALKKMGIQVNKYFATEIDKYAIKNSSHNFPEIIHLGDIRNVKAKDLPRIDLVVGGSPCQGFSRSGKQLNFDDPRSLLFFEFERLVKEVLEINPNAYYLLENVGMLDWCLNEITRRLFMIPPIMINSKLMSAQSRPRWYWTNAKVRKEGLFDHIVSDISQPSDQHIYLNDILSPEDQIDKRFYLSQDQVDKLFGSYKDRVKFNNLRGNPKLGRTEEAKQVRREHLRRGRDYTPFSKQEVVDIDFDKMQTITTAPTKDNLIVCFASRGRGDNYVQTPEPRDDNKTNCITSALKDNLIYIEGEDQDFTVRRLTVEECMRLQMVPGWYKWVVSETQAYKMLGNGWTISVIEYLFGHMDLK